jgi:hypothetical protein
LSGNTQTRWLVLAFQLPAGEAYARVKVWRRLQGIGAVSFRNAVYLLPANEQTQEDFEWILREIRASGGDGAVFEAELTASSRDQELRNLFDAAREDDYRELADELRPAVTGTPRRAAESSERRTLAARVRRRLHDIESIDFFAANGRDTVHALLERLEHAPDAAQRETPMPQPATSPVHAGSTWVTRVGVRVDRMASAWLIRRFIDPQAHFKFVAARGYRPQPGEIRFDMFEAEYTHDADRCTFEVLLDLVDRDDDGLRAISEIVHDLDIKDHKFERPEAAGIRQLIDGIVAGSPSDDERLERSSGLFDDLYRSFSTVSR